MRYLVVVIDPVTNNQTDFEFDCTRAYITTISQCCGISLSEAMKRLKARSHLMSGEVIMGICLYCGEPVRGLKDAPEIAIHYANELRRCADEKNFAEFGGG